MDAILAVFEWFKDPAHLALVVGFIASLANAVLPNDSRIVRLTRWLAFNIGQARPGAPQESFTRFVSGLLR